MKKSLTASIVAMAVLTLSAAPLPATAATPPADPTDTIELRTEPPAPFSLWSFGGIPIGTDTRTLVIDLDLPVVNEVECWGETSEDESFSRTWTPEGWLAAPTIELDEGFANAPGGYVVVTCRSGNEEYYAGFLVTWSLEVVESAGESLTLSDDPAHAYSRVTNNYVNTAEPAVVAGTPGQPVRLVGPAGTFYSGAPPEAVFGLGNIAHGIFEYYIWAEGEEVAPDGSTVTFTLPATVPAEFYDEPMYAKVYASTPYGPVPGGGSGSTATIWYGGFDLTPPDASPHASSTRISLNHTIALSIQRVRATAVVTTTEPVPLTARVTFLVDGVAIGSAEVSTVGRADILLPRLQRGWHSVTAEYAGNATVAPSASLPAAMRILL
jgi:hypothetical protein